MTILPRVDTSLRIDVPLVSADVRLGVGVDPGNVGGTGIDIAVSTAVTGLGVHIGLDRVLNSDSPVDRLLSGPDALARFRAGAVPADPSPVATRGMTIRQGDPYVEVATRYAVGGVGVAAASVRGDIVARSDDAGVAARATVGADSRGVAAVRDPVAAAALPQRIGGIGGATAPARGIDVGMIRGGVIVLPMAAAGVERGLTPFAGLVDVLGVRVFRPGDAVPGTILAYQRGDGVLAAELRTTTGFAGAVATSALPLSLARSDESYLLAGAFVRPEAAAPLPPDGAGIPAGHPAPPGDREPGFEGYPDSAAATDRPYLHAIWYDILALRFAEAGVHLTERSAALRDVVWAIALEHGPFALPGGGDILAQAALALDLAHADDAAIIAALYAERARTAPAGDLVHYPEVLPGDQARVLDRLAAEAELAAGRAVGG